jgi:hypothetical protein
MVETVLPKEGGGMGFRDFQSFNLAMLAKQISRPINDLDSLCTQVLRAKYYPEGDIMKAGPKVGCSFTWRSLLAGLTIWRVGNGEKIDIWKDLWLPSGANGKITTLRGGVLYSKVHELISPITATWDEDLLRDIFNSVDVERILQIPINNHGFDDFIAWRGTRHGRYTVKSGYYIQWKHQFGPRAGQLSLPGSSAQNPVWIWKLQVPSKVKKNLVGTTWDYTIEMYLGKQAHRRYCSMPYLYNTCGGCEASPI